ncbi:MAG: hypothetical protein ACJ780_19600 [Solirubrobacteraceae bacterium]
MIEDPHDRGTYGRRRGRPSRFGASCTIWWAFGEHDGVFLLEAPDDVAVTALATTM